MLWLYLCGALSPFWVIVSRLSTNLLFDGALYDILMCITFIIGMIIFGTGKGFTAMQWAGLTISMLGLVLMKVEDFIK